MIVVLRQSRRRLPRAALSFASPGSVALQLAALASGVALGVLLANAARNTLAALVAAIQQSSRTDLLSGPALFTIAWAFVFVGSSLLFRWGISRALAAVISPILRRRRFGCEADFGPGLKGHPRLD